MPSFKAGEKVRCVDASPHGMSGSSLGGSPRSPLKKGYIYTIKTQHPTVEQEYELVEVGYSWAGSRFVSFDPNAPPINNHTCTTCKNDRCSSTEKSCWKCGEPISPITQRSP